MLDYSTLFNFITCSAYITTSLCLILSGVIFFSENSIYSVLSLLLIVILVSILLILYGIEFFAAIYLFVYAGALVVTFLFVIMSINLRKEDTVTSHTRLISLVPSAILAAIFSLILSYNVFSFNIYFDYINTERKLDVITTSTRVQSEMYTSDIMLFNNLLYTYYAPYLLLLGCLLLLAVVASVALCLHNLRYIAE